MSSWLPELVRRGPAQDLAWRYRSASPVVPEDVRRRLVLAVRTAGTTSELDERSAMDVAVRLPWMTLVFGVVPWTVHEEVRIAFGRDHRGPYVDVRCTPLATHEAHATGAALVLAIASAIWLAGGVAGGLLPAGTTLVGGGLWTDLTRRSAMVVLDRRLGRLTDDLGRAVWSATGGFPERLKS